MARMAVPFVARLAPAIATLIVAGACGAAVDGTGSVDVPPGGFDLTDASLQASLGASPVASVQWQRMAGDVTVIGAFGQPDPDEISLIEAVARDVPAALWRQVDVRNVVRSSVAPGARTEHRDPIAYALGPDVYLLDRAFGLSSGGSSRYELARAFIHELVHVAQFSTMSDDYIAAALSGATDQVDPTIGSELVSDFASDTGWSRSGTQPTDPWTLPDDVAASSAYGRTSAGEDMAEAVSLVAVGLADLVPADRVRWVERWLGVSAPELARGRPWAPPGSVEVLSEDNLYDEASVALATRDREHAEPLYFQLPAGLGDGVAISADINRHLLDRGLSGSIAPLDRSGSVPRFGGTFAGPGGVLWWVELWDFRHRAAGSTGPDRPILTYVAMW